MKTLRSFLLAGAALMAAGSAFAADLPIAGNLAPAPVSVASPIRSTAVDWTGFSVGAQGGFGWSRFEGGPFLQTAWSLAPLRKPDADGGFGGINLQAYYQFPTNIVIGAALEANFAGIEKTHTNGFGDTTKSKVDRFGFLSAKLGYAYESFLPYIQAGVAYERQETATQIAGFVASGKQDQWGYTIGAGVDYLLTPNVVLGIGYRYADFGKKSNARLGDSFGNELHLVQGTASYRF